MGDRGRRVRALDRRDLARSQVGEASKEVALGLVSLLSFSFGWSPQPGVMLSVGLAMLRVADVKQQVPRL